MKRDIIIEIKRNANLKDFSLFYVDLFYKDVVLTDEQKQNFAKFYIEDWFIMKPTDDYIILFNYPYKCAIIKKILTFLQKLFCKNEILICLDLSDEEVKTLIDNIQSFGLKAKESNYKSYDKEYGYMWTTNKKDYYLVNYMEERYTIRNKKEPLKIYTFPEFDASYDYVVRKMLEAGVEVRKEK